MKLMGWVNVAGVWFLVSGVVLVCWHWEWFVMGTAGRDGGSTTVRNLGIVIGGVIAIWVAVWRGVVADRVPPLISWTDKTHHTQAAGCKARRCLA